MQTKHMRITVDGKLYEVTVELLDEPLGRPLTVTPSVARTEAGVTPRPAEALAPPAAAPRSSDRPAGAVASPMSGRVLSVDVRLGQQVKPGESLVTLEAMKMKAPVRAESAGTVSAIMAQAGMAVEEGATLLVLD